MALCRSIFFSHSSRNPLSRLLNLERAFLALLSSTFNVRMSFSAFSMSDVSLCSRASDSFLWASMRRDVALARNVSCILIRSLNRACCLRAWFSSVLFIPLHSRSMADTIYCDLPTPGIPVSIMAPSPLNHVELSIRSCSSEEYLNISPTCFLTLATFIMTLLRLGRAFILFSMAAIIFMMSRL